MSPKRKIPSRKLPSRKFATAKSTKQSSQPTEPKPTGPKPTRPKPTRPKPTKSKSPAVAPASAEPTIPQCFWDMGFEEYPTLEELRQRYKELSLVLHPDAGGNKQAFVDLRTNYETALTLLE